MQKRNGAGIALAVATAAIGGCASVSVRKVPTPTQYVTWSDDMQRQADRMEGFRFYLPRPFVNVFESFPVRTDIYLANGVVSPDEKYIIITSVDGESGLSRYIASPNAVASIPLANVSDPNQVLAAAKAQSERDDKPIDQNQGGMKVPLGVTGTKADEPAPVLPSPSASVVTGQNARGVRNDNGAYAYQPLRGNLDIVYLPDFEEQYVISSQSGLGNAKFEVNLGQGWSLQGFNSLTDNSEINKRIFDLIDTSIRLAKTAASAAIGVPPPAIDAVPGAAIAQAERDVPKAVKSGTPVTLKIVVLHYAAKGIYPVIKPRELSERTISESEKRFVLDLFESSPTIQRASSVDPRSLARAQAAIENQSGNFTVPRYPFQYVSFNTFRYMAIQVVAPGDPFSTLYDKTGTQGDPGDRQKVDLSNRISSGGIPQTSPPVESLSEEAVKAWNEKLASASLRIPVKGDDYYKVKSIARSADGKTLQVALVPVGVPSPALDPGITVAQESAAIEIVKGAMPAGSVLAGETRFDWLTEGQAISSADAKRWNEALAKPPLVTALAPDAANSYTLDRVALGQGPIQLRLKKVGAPGALTDALKTQIIQGALARYPAESKSPKPTEDLANFEFKADLSNGISPGGVPPTTSPVGALSEEAVRSWNDKLASAPLRIPAIGDDYYKVKSIERTADGKSLQVKLIPVGAPSPALDPGLATARESAAIEVVKVAMPAGTALPDEMKFNWLVEGQSITSADANRWNEAIAKPPLVAALVPDNASSYILEKVALGQGPIRLQMKRVGSPGPLTDALKSQVIRDALGRYPTESASSKPPEDLAKFEFKEVQR